MSKVKFNISNAHVAPKTVGENEKIEYGPVVAVPGSVALSLEAKGEMEKFFADGIVYYKASVNNGYEGDWELAMVTDALRELILKELKDTNKVLLEKINVESTEFAFGCQIDGDVKNTRFWFYNCTASRPGTNGKTNEETKTPQTDTLKLTATPEKVIDGSEEYFVRAKTTDETSADIYNNWFKQVYIPTLTEE